MVTLLPAVLVIFGRWIFWPVKPGFGSAEPTSRGFWSRVGQVISRRPRTVWLVTAILLGAGAAGMMGFKFGTLPLVEFTEIGFAVALGVLLDTIIVRPVLVTALTLDIGRHVWWPSRLARPREESLLANPESRAVTHGT